MKAAVWYGRHDVRVEEVEDPPKPCGEDVLVEVHWAGICGTDLHEYMAGPIFIPPAIKRVVLGHEFSATVVAVGDEVSHVKPGDRVAVVPHRPCRTCHFCQRGMLQHCANLQLVGITRNGAFARHTIARQDQLVALPNAISNEIGALIEPLSVTMRAMQFPGVHIGDDIAIIGAGPIGLCAVATARATGSGHIFVVEMLPRRAELARKLGATAVINPRNENPSEAIRNLTGGRGVDVALECVGLISTMNLAIELARPGGLAVLIGVAESIGDLDLHRAVADEKEVRGCIGYFGGEWNAVVDLLASGRLDPAPLITHKIAVDDIVNEGFGPLIEDKDSCIKVLVHP